MKIDDYSLKLKTMLVISTIFSSILLFLVYYRYFYIVLFLFLITLIILIKTPINKDFTKEMFSKKKVCLSVVIEFFLVCSYFWDIFYWYFSNEHGTGENAAVGLVFKLVLVTALFLLAVPIYSFFFLYFSDGYHTEFKKKIYDFVFGNKFYYVCYTLVVISFVIQIRYAFTLDIFGDEGFTLGLIKNNYIDVIKFTAQDVHPPLYYIIVKTFVDFVHLILPELNVIYIAKLASVIPYIVLFIVFNTKIRKLFGNYVSTLCLLFLLGFSSVISKILEIRMYGWGLFFVFLAFLEFYSIIKYEKRKNWVFFVLYSLGAAYTHYFACVSVALLYIILFIYYLKRKDNKQIKNFFFAALFTLLIYIPWFIVVVIQMINIKNTLWVAPIRWEDFKGFFMFAFNGRLIFAIGIIYIVLLIKKLLKKDAEPVESFCAISAIGVNIWTILVGTTISVFYRPVFICRYMIPSLLCLWFGIILVSKLIKKDSFRFFMSLIVLYISVAGIFSFAKTEHDNLKQFNETINFINEVSDDGEAIFVTTTIREYWILPSLTKSKICYFVPDTYENNMEHEKQFYADVSELVFSNSNTETIYSEKDILSFLEESKNVYFIPLIGNDLNDIKVIKSEKVGDYFLGGHIDEFYKLSYKPDS